MTIHEFAEMLNGALVDHEMTKEEELIAEQNGYVVVFGAESSCLFRGAIDDEEFSFADSKIYIRDGAVISCPDCYCEHAEKWYEEQKKGALVIDAIWYPEDENGYAWSYKLSDDRPCAKFDIIDYDGSLYCQGLVFAL